MDEKKMLHAYRSFNWWDKCYDLIQYGAKLVGEESIKNRKRSEIGKTFISDFLLICKKIEDTKDEQDIG